MIIVKLFGGVGNQMFQYAAGRSLALKNNCELKLDITHFDTLILPNDLPYRSFDLSIFDLDPFLCTEEEIKKFNYNTNSFLEKGFRKVKNVFSKYTTVCEPYFHFYEDFLKNSGNVYIDGYWQSEKYFKHIEQIIRNDFKIKTTLNAEGLTILEKIKNTNSVCVNIRRQELASNKYSTQFVGLDYLNNAIEAISKKEINPHFFIFSDELSWVKENIKIDYQFTIVEESLYGDKYRDCLFLMSSCKHFIIPNSTFGWWAAWLSGIEKKVVITPNKWFTDNTKDTRDLIPEEWIKL